MSSSISFQFDFDEIEREIENLGKDIKKVEANATKKGAEIVAEKLKENTPRSDINDKNYTHMQDNIKISSLREDKETLDNVREVGFGKLQYKAKWLEFGTSIMKGTAFMTKTIQETKDEVQDTINNAIKKELNL